MIRLITCRLMQSFSVQNKTQNFFDMNPVYPDFGQKNFDIYNSQRKKIGVIDEYIRHEIKDRRIRNLVRHRLYLPKYDKFKRYSGGRNFRIQKDTKLVLGMDSDFDDFVATFKRDKFMDKNAKSQFKETLLKLIYKFKCKSQPELIRLFRISVANSKKKSLLDKLRGNVMQQAVLKTAQIMKNYESFQKKNLNEKDIEQQQFQKALKDIDKKIQEAQNSLNYDQRGIPKVLSNYDPKYGWKQTRQFKANMDFDLNVWEGRYATVETSSAPQRGNQQDWSIRTRINRLYFLKRLEFLQKGKTQFQNNDFVSQLPLNIRERDKIMNELAFKYKEDQLLQPPDLSQIYNEIDGLIDKVFIKISPGKSGIDKSGRYQIYDRTPAPKDFMWQNISAQEILCDTMYDSQTTRNIVLTEDYLRDISPNADTELTLSKLPINLFRHSQLDCIGVFNQYREKLSKTLLSAQQTQFQPYFQQFSLEQAHKKYKKISRTFVEKKTSAIGHAKRKTAMASAKISKGTGIVRVNGMLIQDYIGDTFYRVEALKPLVFTDTSGLYDVTFHARGSGLKGQSQCMAYALARALMKVNPEHKRILAKFGLVGYDFRKKEAKKTNLYSARVRPPYVRR